MLMASDSKKVGYAILSLTSSVGVFMLTFDAVRGMSEVPISQEDMQQATNAALGMTLMESLGLYLINENKDYLPAIISGLTGIAMHAWYSNRIATGLPLRAMN